MAISIRAPVGPDGIVTAWTLDPLVAFGSVLAAALYWRGHRYLRGRDARFATSRKAAAFAGGLGAIDLALLSPLDAWSHALFSAHMVQHLVLIAIAAPLLVLARPFRTMLAGLSPRTRRFLARSGSMPVPSVTGRAVRRPLVAWILFAAVLWAWHLPTLYAAALGSDPLHVLEHASFLLTSMLTWSVALDERPGAVLPALGRALFLLSTALQSGLLGALLLFAGGPLYPVHAAGAAAWNLTSLQDQQLAGALMWVSPSAIYVGAAAALLLRWFRSMEVPVAPERRERVA